MKLNMLLAMCVALLCGTPVVAGDRGEIVAVMQLSETVRRSIDAAAGNVDWIFAFKFEERDRPDPYTWYRVGGKDSHDRLVKIMVKENGEIADVRTSIQVAGLSPAAKAAVTRKYPSFQIKEVEAVGKTTRSTAYYNLKGEEHGVDCVVRVSANGSKVGKTP